MSFDELPKTQDIGRLKSKVMFGIATNEERAQLDELQKKEDLSKGIENFLAGFDQ